MWSILGPLLYRRSYSTQGTKHFPTDKETQGSLTGVAQGSYFGGFPTLYTVGSDRL